jgi:hypothetical protein
MVYKKHKFLIVAVVLSLGIISTGIAVNAAPSVNSSVETASSYDKTTVDKIIKLAKSLPANDKGKTVQEIIKLAKSLNPVQDKTP